MNIDFILPDIGEGIVECELVDWLVSEGETIAEDQPIAEVMTDKALVQIPAMYAGVLEKHYYKKGEIAKVHAPLFAMSVLDASTAVEQTKQSNEAPQITTMSAVAANDVEQDNAEIPVTNSNVYEDFILPDIGEGIVECELVEWLVKEGDVIEEDQAVVDVMTDKALVQIPAMHAGRVAKLYYKKGDIAKVHQPLFSLEINSGKAISPVVESKETVAIAVNHDVIQPHHSEAVISSAEKLTLVNGKALASPAVRRIARELKVDIHQVPGSGKKGRVYKADVVNFSQFSEAKLVETNATNEVNTEVRVEAIRGVRAAMAKAMVNSVSSIAHFTYCEEIDMTNLQKLRRELQKNYDKEEVNLTMLPFIMKALSLALDKFPLLNSQVNEDCTEIRYQDDHNIGMAVDSAIGLLVPNIKQVQNKSILLIAKEVTRLTTQARKGRLASADLSGGSITISNIGAIGGTVATPIINKPEVAIVALGRLQRLPRFNSAGEVEARDMMQISWSGDHRIIDGATMAYFCNLWKSFLESPQTMLMHMT